MVWAGAGATAAAVEVTPAASAARPAGFIHPTRDMRTGGEVAAMLVIEAISRQGRKGLWPDWLGERAKP